MKILSSDGAVGNLCVKAILVTEKRGDYRQIQFAIRDFSPCSCKSKQSFAICCCHGSKVCGNSQFLSRLTLIDKVEEYPAGNAFGLFKNRLEFPEVSKSLAHLGTSIKRLVSTTRYVVLGIIQPSSGLQAWKPYYGRCQYAIVFFMHRIVIQATPA